MKIIKLIVSILLLIGIIGCVNPANDGNAPSPQEEITGDYTYEKQHIWDPILPDYTCGFHCYSLSALKYLYIAAGQAPENFDQEYQYACELNKRDGDISLREMIDIPDKMSRDYFLTVFDLIRDHQLLLCAEDAAYQELWISSWAPDFVDLHLSYRYYPNKTSYYAVSVQNPITSSADEKLPDSDPNITIDGDGYTITLWKTTDETDKPVYEGRIVCDDQAIDVFGISIYYSAKEGLPGDIPQYILDDLANYKVMTLYDAMVAAPLPEDE